MKLNPRHAGFTLMELMVSSAIACFIGIIIYTVATENLVAFEKNFSINRSYGDGRRSLDRLGIAMQSAGHVPILIDATERRRPPPRHREFAFGAIAPIRNT